MYTVAGFAEQQLEAMLDASYVAAAAGVGTGCSMLVFGPGFARPGPAQPKLGPGLG